MAFTKSDKQFIEDIVDKALIKQEVKLESKLDDIEQKFEAKITEFKDEFYTKIDPILKEVVASREDRTMGAEQYIRNEKRIEKLEKIHPKGVHLAVI